MTSQPTREWTLYVCRTCGGFADHGAHIRHRRPLSDPCGAEVVSVRVVDRAMYEEKIAALERIRDWDGDEHYLDDVEVELKAIARAALGEKP